MKIRNNLMNAWAKRNDFLSLEEVRNVSLNMITINIRYDDDILDQKQHYRILPPLQDGYTIPSTIVFEPTDYIPITIGNPGFGPPPEMQMIEFGDLPETITLGSMNVPSIISFGDMPESVTTLNNNVYYTNKAN